MTTERTNGEPTQRGVSSDVPQPEELERQRTEMDDRDVGGGQFEPPKQGYTPGAPPQPTDVRGKIEPPTYGQSTSGMMSKKRIAVAGVGALALLAAAGAMRAKQQRRARSKQNDLIHQAEAIVRRLEEQLQRT